jgi:hypothetical protein
MRVSTYLSSCICDVCDIVCVLFSTVTKTKLPIWHDSDCIYVIIRGVIEISARVENNVFLFFVYDYFVCTSYDTN